MAKGEEHKKKIIDPGPSPITATHTEDFFHNKTIKKNPKKKIRNGGNLKRVK
jgi:hypothetical protein